MNPLTPDPNSSIWPPPPSVSLPQAQTYPFRTLFSYVQGSVPDFREGVVVLSPDGVSIQGKAVLRTEIQVPILIFCLLLRYVFLIAYMIMEYGIRRDALLRVPWSDVQSLVLVPKKNRVCLVYQAPNYKGIVKTFSLTWKMEPALYAAFVSDVQQSIPARVGEGKLRAWTSPKVWVFCGGLVVSLLIFLGIYVLSPRGLAGH